MASEQTVTRRVDSKPETAADKRFFDLRQAGYTGPIDQDGYQVTSGPRRRNPRPHAAQEPLTAERRYWS